MNIKFTCLSTTLPNIKASLGGIQDRDVDQHFEIRRRSEEYVHLRDKRSPISGIMGLIKKVTIKRFLPENQALILPIGIK